MKKIVTKTLALGLCLTLVGGALVACGPEDDSPADPFATAKGTWAVSEGDSYWLAGTLVAYTDPLLGQWDEPEEGRVPDAVRFEQNSENKNLYRITLNLYEKDIFKIRYEGLGWDEEPGKSKLSFDSLDEKLQEAENAAIIDGGGVGGSNFEVAISGQYEIRLNTSGDNAVVTYVRKADAPVLVKTVTLDKQSAILAVGGAALNLTATIDPANATDKTMTWTSSDTTIATVTDGAVTAVAEGKATITVTVGGKTASCIVFVVAEGTEIVEPTEVTLDKTTLDLHVGDAQTIVATKAPADATGEVVYTSSDPKVATVDPSTGEVTAVGAGTATITATLLNKTAECKVTVALDYYIVGKAGGTENWNVQTNVAGIPTGRAFAKDKESGKYTLDITLNRGDSFKAIFLGMPSDWTGAVGFGNVKQAEDDKKFVDGGSGNIKVADSAVYTLTLDVSKSEPELTYVIKEDIADTTYSSVTVYVKGSGNSWGGYYQDTDGNDITGTANAENSWTVELTLDLAANEEFGIPVLLGDSTEQNSWIGANQGVIGNNADAELFGNASNYVCKTAGTYKFTLVFNEYGECVSVTAVAV